MTEKIAQWPSQEWPVLWIKLTAMASLAIMVIFGLWPGLDLAVTGYFYSPADSFWVRQSALIETLRMGLWRLSAIMVLFVWSLWSLAHQRVGSGSPDAPGSMWWRFMCWDLVFWLTGFSNNIGAAHGLRKCSTLGALPSLRPFTK